MAEKSPPYPICAVRRVLIDRERKTQAGSEQKVDGHRRQKTATLKNGSDDHEDVIKNDDDDDDDDDNTSVVVSSSHRKKFQSCQGKKKRLLQFSLRRSTKKERKR